MRMDFTEDNKLVEESRKYNKKANRWGEWFGAQLTFNPDAGFLCVLGKIGYLFLGFVVMSALSLGFGGFLISTLIIYAVLLVIKLVFWKTNEHKAKSIWKTLNDKYIPIRNEYMEKKAEEIGCTSKDKATTDTFKKEWDLPSANGYIKGQSHVFTYIYSSLDNYGDIVIKCIPKDETDYSNELSMLRIMDEKYKNEGYSQLDVGVSKFNEKYRVYTKDMVKARTYFSATMIQAYLTKKMGIDYKILGNNIYLEWNPYGQNDYDRLLSHDFNFIAHDVTYYFEQVDNYFKQMLDFRDVVENGDMFVLK